MKTKLLTLAAVALSASAVQGFILVGPPGTFSDGMPNPGSPVPVGANWEYTYSIWLSQATVGAPPTLTPGSYFTVYDYPGLISASGMNASWSIGYVAPAPTLPVVDGTGGDIHVVYVDPVVTSNPSFTPMLLGDLKVLSSLGGPVQYAGPNFQSFVSEKPPGNPSPALNTANLAVPVPEGSTVFSMIGLGVLGAGYFVRRRMAA